MPERLVQEVRLYVFRQAAETVNVPQPPQIAEALGRPETEIQEVLRYLAVDKVLILAPNNSNIWAANPFCAVPMGFRVDGRVRLIREFVFGMLWVSLLRSEQTP